MGRLVAAVLVGCCALLNAGAALAEDPESPSPDASQRLIAPQHGVAITVPASWRTIVQDPDGEPLSSSSLVRRREMVGAAAPLHEAIGVICSIHVYSTEDGTMVSLEQEVGGFIADALQNPYVVFVATEPEPVELPVGPALRVSVDTRSVEPHPVARVHQYFIGNGAEVYLVSCWRDPWTDDSWLSIAETFEFLPAEE